jgi:hypothetical protein
MFENKEEKERKATRERVKRYREKKKSEAVTAPLQPVTTTVTDTKMVCKCQYFIMRDGILVCSQCGKPPAKKPVEDKILRHVETK